MKIALLSLSGGLDSTSLLLHILMKKEYDKIYTYSFKYGQNHSIELDLAQRNADLFNKLLKQPIVHHQTIDLSSIFADCGSSLTSGSSNIPKGQDYNEGNQQSTVIPIRNVIFASILYSKASGLINTFLKESNDISVDIFTGVHSNDHTVYPDCRPQSVQMAQQLFKISDYHGDKINYNTPFVDYSKGQVLSSGISAIKQLGFMDHLDEIYQNTITCYAPNENGESCGQCASCKDRLQAFEDNHLKDPIPYVTI